MARDSNFSPTIKSELAQAAQYHCVRPGCNQPTHFYAPSMGRLVHFGAAAHDAPASENEGGERSDNDLTPEQKKAYGNGAWLCRNCSTLVDVAQSHFPLQTLPTWQRKASEARKNAVFSPVPPSHINYTEAITKAQKFIELTKDVRIDGCMGNMSVSIPSRHAMDRVVQLCFHLPPLNEYSSLFPHTVNVQQRMVADLLAIKNEISNLSNWHTSDGYYRPNDKRWNTHEKIQEIQSSEMGVDKLVDDYYTAREYLRTFISGRVNHTLLYLW